ncbi:MAG: hypothetical protein QM817_10540 [Archangium sp.]
MRRALIGLNLFTALGALFGALAMFLDPHGSPIGLSQELLSRTPFADYRVPGVLLLVTNGLLPLIAAIAAATHRAWAFAAQFAAAAALMGWMGGQFALVGYVAPIQIVMVVVGVLELRFAMDHAHPLRAITG